MKFSGKYELKLYENTTIHVTFREKLIWEEKIQQIVANMTLQGHFDVAFEFGSKSFCDLGFD